MEAVRGISRNVIEDRDEKAVRAVEKVEFSSDAMAGETARFSREEARKLSIATPHACMAALTRRGPA